MPNKLFLYFVCSFFTLSIVGMEENQNPLDLYIAAHSEKEKVSNDIVNIAFQFKLLLAEESEAEKHVIASCILKNIENIQDQLGTLTQTLIKLYPHLPILRSLDTFKQTKKSTNLKQ